VLRRRRTEPVVFPERPEVPEEPLDR
jgi:hypothetical protein